MISETLAERIREMLGKEFRVLGWQEANRPVLSALDLESKAAFLSFLFVGIIAAAHIAAAILLLVAERRADIAVLRSCGMRTRNVAVIFLFQAMIVGSLGAFLGIILGFGICFVLNDLWTINVPGEIYLVSEFALLPMWTDIVFLLPAVILLSAVGGLYPALAAARIKPIEDLNKR